MAALWRIFSRLLIETSGSWRISNPTQEAPAKITLLQDIFGLRKDTDPAILVLQQAEAVGRAGRAAECGGLLIHPDLFAQTNSHLFC
jgi:hypothetical protein